MKKKSRFKEILEIPKEVYSNIPNFIITGFEEIIIENYKGILEYEEYLVRISTFIGIININGINLRLEKMTEDIYKDDKARIPIIKYFKDKSRKEIFLCL